MAYVARFSFLDAGHDAWRHRGDELDGGNFATVCTAGDGDANPSVGTGVVLGRTPFSLLATKGQGKDTVKVSQFGDEQFIQLLMVKRTTNSKFSRY